MNPPPFAVAPPWWIAHRGDARCHLENSASAIRAAATTTAHAIEIDLRLTADGEIVVIHDDDLVQSFGSTRKVAECSLADLRAHASADAMPTLEQALAVQNQLPLFLEMKSDPQETAQRRRHLAEKTAHLAGDFAGPTPVLLSFDPELLLWAAADAPHLPLAHNLADPRDRPAPLDCAAFWSCATATLDPAWIRDAHRRGHRVLTYTVFTAQQAQQAFALGVDGVFSEWLPPELGEIPE